MIGILRIRFFRFLKLSFVVFDQRNLETDPNCTNLDFIDVSRSKNLDNLGVPMYVRTHVFVFPNSTPAVPHSGMVRRYVFDSGFEGKVQSRRHLPQTVRNSQSEVVRLRCRFLGSGERCEKSNW